MVGDTRIWNHPTIKFERKKKVRFTFDGKEIVGYEGETVAAALYASGRRVFSRSIRYHRPRGYYCGVGRCASCMMRVDGVPNTRICTLPIREGMVVESQNRFPSLDLDLLRIVDYLFPHGIDYHKMFIRPRFLRETYNRFIRRFAGIGKPPEPVKSFEPPEQGRRSAQLTVVGGGPAGLCAAVEAANSGVDVLLVDENPKLGGRLRREPQRIFQTNEKEEKTGSELLKELLNQVEKAGGKEEGKGKILVMLNTTATGIYQNHGNKTLVLTTPENLVQVETKTIVVATGSHDQPELFENNDLPGVMTSTAAQMLMNVYGVKPGERAVVLGINKDSLELGKQLLDAGVEIACFVDQSQKRVSETEKKVFDEKNIPFYSSHKIKKVLGHNQVKKAVLAHLNEDGSESGEEEKIACDLVCLALGRRPSCELTLQTGCKHRMVPELGGFTPLRDKKFRTTVKGVYVAGGTAGIMDTAGAMLSGRVAGLSAATDLGIGGEKPLAKCEQFLKQFQDYYDNLDEETKVGIAKTTVEEVC